MSTSTTTTTHTRVSLSKQRILMDRVEFPDGDDALVIFASDMEEPITSGTQRSASLHYQDWQDMGSPDVITVTIEPGDHLQDGEES